jgi:filamentous hemagglutinin family protein
VFVPFVLFRKTTASKTLTLTLLSCSVLLCPAQAQTIAPAADGTGTRVILNGNQIDISGGQLSGDRTNLFHSFSQFGLSQGQIANFLSNPSIQNILARVTGGEASVINGLLQVTGGNSNLYLINPAGILFGVNASLNVPAAFTATTANGIGLGCGATGCGAWFDAVGTNDYASLVGTPGAFAFSAVQPGAIANSGNLAVGQEQSLSLLGASVLNTGTLTAPGGSITIAAVPGETLVRLTQQGALLSLEFSPLPPLSPALPFSPLSLPQLLTGGSLVGATGATVENGVVRLTSSNTVVPADPGTTIISGQVSVAQSLPIADAPAPTPQITVLGDRIGLFAATLDASSPANGGIIRIGGDYLGGGAAPPYSPSFRLHPSVNARFTSISSDSRLTADSLQNGNGGQVILWSEQATRFYGTISARGGTQSGNGGFIETSSRNALDVRGSTVDATAPRGQAGTWLLDPRNITIQAAATSGGAFDGGDPNLFEPLGDDAIVDINDILDALNAGTSVTITTGVDGPQAGDIRLEAPLLPSATGNPTLRLDAANDILINATINATGGEGVNIDLNAGRAININSEIRTAGGSFTSNSGGDFTASGSIITTDPAGTAAGDLSITSGGAIATAALIAAQIDGATGSGGSVTLDAGGAIRVASIDARASGFGTGGDVSINTPETFQATGTFRDFSTNTDVSISTSGPDGGGAIAIEQTGDADSPFIVGDASINGTEGAITTGTDTISPPQILFEDFAQGGIQVSTAAEGDTFDDDDLETDEDEEGIEDDVDVATAADEGNDFADADAEEVDEEFSDEFDDYLDIPEDEVDADKDPGTTLSNVLAQTGVKPALVYLVFRPANVAQLPDTPLLKNGTMRAESGEGTENGNPQDSKPAANNNDQLELILVTADGNTVRRLIAGATRGRVIQVARQFIREVGTPRGIRTTRYLAPAQQLYRWLVAPLEAELQTRKVGNIAFIAETGLRFIPFAALHDGQQFVVEKYSIGLMPSFSLTDGRIVSLKDAKVLAMGASEFADQTPLPAVPTELSVIANDLWTGDEFLNDKFTLENLKTQRQQQPYRIIHLATHGEFQPGQISNSYIQLWDTKLRMDQIRQLGWSNPPVDLLVLSACRTAIGDDQAELGFAGFAVQSGVKTALASLWYVSDEGTLALMTEFYRQLQTAPIKAEAIRRAQIAMLRGDVKIEGGKLRDSRGEIVTLPPALAEIKERNLTHPYYWAAFTLIGSPW